MGGTHLVANTARVEGGAVAAYGSMLACGVRYEGNTAMGVVDTGHPLSHAGQDVWVGGPAASSQFADWGSLPSVWLDSGARITTRGALLPKGSWDPLPASVDPHDEYDLPAGPTACDESGCDADPTAQALCDAFGLSASG